MTIPDSYLSYFTPGQMSHETLEFILVGRHRLLERLVDRVRRSTTSEAKYHSILLGPRGMGKSHLVALVYHRVKALSELEDKVVIAWLAEEEWGVASLTDLFLVILKALAREYPASGLQIDIDALYRLPINQISDAAGQKIRDFVGGRTLFLLMENLEEIFRGLGEDGQWAFRSFLSEHPFVTILATTPSLFAGIQRQEQAFYGFFQSVYLEELTVTEATELLGKVAERRGDTHLMDFLKTPVAQDRVQAVHDLAGGHPRIYLLFAHLITDTALDELVSPFLQLLDELTPYYQSRIQLLSPQQRKIVEYLCDRRGAVTVKEIAAGNLLTPQTTASQLGELDKMAYVRKNQVGRESYYELFEPLLRMVIEMKRGRGQPIRLIVDFLRRWYSRGERRDRLIHAPAHALLTRQYLEASLDLTLAHQDAPDLKRAEKLSPEWREAYKARDYDRSSELAAEIIERKGRLAEADDWLQYSQCMLMSGKFQQALIGFDRATELEPKDVWVWRDRGAVLSSMGLYSQALESFDRAIEIQPDFAVAWMNRGIALARQNQYDQAFKSLDRAIELEPEFAIAWFNRGVALADLGQYDQALANFDQAIKLESKFATAWTNRGVALARQNQYDQALKSFNRAIELEPGSVMAWFNRGNALSDLSQYDKALESFDRAIDIEPEFAKAWFNRGVALADLGQYDQALANFDQAIKLDHEDATTCMNRGSALSDLGRYNEALESFDRAIELEPKDATAWFNRGSALSDLGRYNEALESFDRAIELEPKDATAWFNRGVIFARQGQYDQALTNFDRAIELEPNLAIAWVNRGNALAHIGRYNQAMENLDQAIELEPELARAWFSRAAVLLHLNQWKESNESIEQAFTVITPTDMFHGNTEEYCRILLKQSEDAMNMVAGLVRVYSNNDDLAMLGQGLIASIPSLLESDVSPSNAEKWLSSWNIAGEDKQDLAIPLRLLAAAVAWKPKHDIRALLALSVEERRILERLLPQNAAE